MWTDEQKLDLTTGLRGYNPGHYLGAVRINNTTGKYWVVSQTGWIIPPWTLGWLKKFPSSAQMIDILPATNLTVVSGGCASPADVPQYFSAMFYEASPAVDQFAESDGYAYREQTNNWDPNVYLLQRLSGWSSWTSANPNTQLKIFFVPDPNHVTVLNMTYLRLSRRNNSAVGIPGSARLRHVVQGLTMQYTGGTANLAPFAGDAPDFFIDVGNTIAPWATVIDFEQVFPSGNIAFDTNTQVTVNMDAAGANIINQIGISIDGGIAVCINGQSGGSG